MTTPRYPHPGCAAVSQAHGEAAAWSSSDAWGVDFSNGGVSSGPRSYYGFALAVRRVGQLWALCILHLTGFRCP